MCEEEKDTHERFILTFSFAVDKFPPDSDELGE